MGCDELSNFTAMFLSEEMQHAFDVESELTRLEEALFRNLQQMNPSNFSLICFALTAGQENLYKRLTMDKLLESASDNVISWLKADKIPDENDLVNIAAAYSSRHGIIKVDSSYSELMETTVLKKSQTLNVEQAIKFVEYLGHTAGPELIEVCDRIVGVNAENISVDDAFTALCAFLNAKAHVRPKIKESLIKKVSNNFEQLENRHLITFADILMSTDRSDMITSNEIDKFLLSRLNSLSPS